MNNKALRLSAKKIIIENKREILKVFSGIIILLLGTFFLINPLVKNFIEMIMKSLDLDNKVYVLYNATVNIISVGISFTISSLIPEFIAVSIALELVENNTFSLSSVKLRLNKISNYLYSKLIAILIQIVWYVILNISRIALTVVFLITIASVFSLGGISVTLGVIENLSFLIFLCTINFIIYANIFSLPFIALDGENEFKIRDIYKTYRKIMKKNRFKSFKLILSFLPMVFILIGLFLIYLCVGNIISTTIMMIFLGLIGILSIVFYPYILITMALFYKRIYNYSWLK
ncbi:hypothetical protein LZ906_017065 (plasmid) [Paraclostridium ghonii]|uniref:hypothetical protein n=1 Tax=Paraclostridium ghonii TaxID=29358 RepID=UPI00202CBF94|nr:hypothetical protein [Paeniclostridium ghonii]MCM0165395.1 hypothetical protein [Paeniclostridium ghonii]